MPGARKHASPHTIDTAIYRLELLNKLLSAYAGETPDGTLRNDELLTLCGMLDEIVAGLNAGNNAVTEERNQLYMQVMRHERPELARLIDEGSLQ